MVWKNDLHTNYYCNDVPYIRISLVDGNEVVHKFVLNELVDYNAFLGHEEGNYLRIKTCLINPLDYSALVSKKYDKYFVEINQTWINATTQEEEVYELPSQVFHNVSVKNNITHRSGDDYIEWEICFYDRI